jgi:hypothetical protein
LTRYIPDSFDWVLIRRWLGGFFILALGAKLKTLDPSFRWDDGGNFTVA